MLRPLPLILLLPLLLAACGHARIAEEADPGAWSRDIPNLLRQTAHERGLLACRNKEPKTGTGERPCAPLVLTPDDKLYVTTAIKQERDEPDGGFELNYIRDVWAFCFIVVRGQTSTEYLADFRRDAIGPDLNNPGDILPSGSAKVVVTLAEGYQDAYAKNGCGWLWKFTENPQIR